MSTVSNAVRDKLVGQYIESAQGRVKLAASMTQPLRLRRDYQSVARKAFFVDQLPDGALPIYDKDPDVAAFVVAEDGEAIQSYIKPRRIIVPLFEIASNPEVALTQIRERRYDVIERMQKLAAAEIQAAEDERCFSIMDAVATSGYDNIGAIAGQSLSVVAPISGAILADAFAQIEQWDLKAEKVFMNANDYADVRKFGRDILDIESQRELLKTGLQATLWGAQIITSRLVPAGTVYVTCSPEFFGRIPVRTELTVLSADNPQKRTVGFSVFENLGCAVVNPRGLATLTVTR